MGQLLSSMRYQYNNNGLTNALVENEVLHTENVEKVFRSVDRGFYCNVEKNNKHKLYQNTFYKYNKIILSPPSIYAISLESLNLQKGQKFLNIGSGIGYFNTLAGLLLGVNGVNHGLEVNQNLINLAYQKLEEFKLNAAAIDYFQFCEPVFIKGYAWELLTFGYYDKVYCETSVPAEKAEFMKSLITIGGTLVMPMDGNLVKITRLENCLYKTNNLVDISTFTKCVIPKRSTYNILEFPSVQPLTLKELCRLKIRSTLRDNLLETLPNLLMPTMCTSNDFLRKFDSRESVPIHSVLNKVANWDYMLETGSTSSSVENDHDDSIPESEEFDDNQTESLAVPSSPYMNCSPKIDKTHKRESVEPGCSEQNHMSVEAENSKMVIMSSQDSDDSSSTSSQCDSNSSASSRSTFQYSDSSEDSDSNEESVENHTEWISSSDDDDDIYRSINSKVKNKYNFIFEYNKNKFSQLLKAKIDSLQLPGPVKQFLNYNRTN